MVKVKNMYRLFAFQKWNGVIHKITVFNSKMKSFVCVVRVWVRKFIGTLPHKTCEQNSYFITTYTSRKKKKIHPIDDYFAHRSFEITFLLQTHY